MEWYVGVESLQGWVKCECVVDMQVVQLWEVLYQVMWDNGLELCECGNGFVI